MQPLRKLETLDVPEVVALYLCAVPRGETTSDEMCGLLSCSVTSTVGLALIRARKCLGAMFKRPRFAGLINLADSIGHTYPAV